MGAEISLLLSVLIVMPKRQCLCHVSECMSLLRHVQLSGLRSLGPNVQNVGYFRAEIPRMKVAFTITTIKKTRQTS